jgi:hypothetical protein
MKQQLNDVLLNKTVNDDVRLIRQWSQFWRTESVSILSKLLEQQG